MDMVLEFAKDARDSNWSVLCWNCVSKELVPSLPAKGIESISNEAKFRVFDQRAV